MQDFDTEVNMANQNARIKAVLESYRVRLQECITSPIDIASFRDDLVRDISALRCCGENELTLPRLVKELKEQQEKAKELEQACIDCKHLENKMKYSTVVQQIEVAKNKVAELATENNIQLRTSDMVVQNQKRIKIEVERLDTIVFKTIKDMPDLSALQHTTAMYSPIRVARKTSLETMKKTVKELDETRKTMAREKLKHRDAVEALKAEIKETKADIDAIHNKNHSIQTTFVENMSAKHSTRTGDMNAALETIKEEIEMIKEEIKEVNLTHNANLASLESDRIGLCQKLQEVKNMAASSISELDAKLMGLKLESSGHQTVLEALIIRENEEMREAEARAEQERLHYERKAQAKAKDEKEHFAALWIQLRWKAHLKRQSMKRDTKKKGKGKGGKKKK